MPEQNKEWEEVMKRIDFAGVMKAFEKGDKEWHAEEWKRFIKEIRHSLLKEILEKIDEEIMPDNQVLAETEDGKRFRTYVNFRFERLREIIEGYLKDL